MFGLAINKERESDGEFFLGVPVVRFNSLQVPHPGVVAMQGVPARTFSRQARGMPGLFIFSRLGSLLQVFFLELGKDEMDVLGPNY